MSLLYLHKRLYSALDFVISLNFFHFKDLKFNKTITLTYKCVHCL